MRIVVVSCLKQLAYYSCGGRLSYNTENQIKGARNSYFTCTREKAETSLQKLIIICWDTRVPLVKNYNHL